MNSQEPIRDARKLGTPKMLLLGLQHMFAMFGATVLVPILVNSYGLPLFIIEYHEGVKKSNSFMISVLIPPQGHQINCGSMRPEWHIIAVVGKKVGSTAINTRR